MLPKSLAVEDSTTGCPSAKLGASRVAKSLAKAITSFCKIVVALIIVMLLYTLTLYIILHLI